MPGTDRADGFLEEVEMALNLSPCGLSAWASSDFLTARWPPGHWVQQLKSAREDVLASKAESVFVVMTFP